MSAKNCNWFLPMNGIDQCSFISLDTKRAKPIRSVLDLANGESPAGCTNLPYDRARSGIAAKRNRTYAIKTSTLNLFGKLRSFRRRRRRVRATFIRYRSTKWRCRHVLLASRRRRVNEVVKPWQQSPVNAIGQFVIRYVYKVAVHVGVYAETP